MERREEDDVEGEEVEEQTPDVDAPKRNPEVIVEYCPTCSLPREYCEYVHGAAPAPGSAASGEPTPGAPAAVPAPPAGGGGKKKKQKEPEVVISTQQRQKRKFITVVVGLETCGIKLSDAAKFFGKHFSCGASVTGREVGPGEEIDIQGDVSDELPELLAEHWHVPESAIKVQERKEKKRGG